MPNCRHGLPAHLCAVCLGTTRQRPGRAQTTGRRSRRGSKQSESVSFTLDRSERLHTLKLRAMIEAGWKECTLGHCFSQQVWVEVVGGQQVRVQVSVWPRPRRALPDPPPFRPSYTHDAGFKVVAVGPILSLSVDLLKDQQFNSDLPWRLTKNGKPFLQLRLDESAMTVAHEADTTSEERDFGLHIRSLLVVQAPPTKPAPVYRDWFRRFLPGGLPELGRR
jgi:hypothetical protein